MIIDSHQHFWKYDSVRDSWIDESMQVIRKDFLPQNLKPILNKNNIDGCIAVQADQSENETQFLLELADKNPFIKGVVGWVDLCADNVNERLAHFSKNKLLKGVRHIVQAELSGFMLQADFQNGIKNLEQFNLIYDILIYPNQIEETIALVKKFPNQLFVVDHLAKPNIKSQKIKNWEKDLKKLAAFENVFCKISGMFTEANWNKWQRSDFTPYLDVVFKAFGTHRIMYGSDWPVCLLSATYEQQLNSIEKYVSEFSSADKALIMGKNALKIYKLKS